MANLLLFFLFGMVVVVHLHLVDEVVVVLLRRSLWQIHYLLVHKRRRAHRVNTNSSLKFWMLLFGFWNLYYLISLFIYAKDWTRRLAMFEQFQFETTSSFNCFASLRRKNQISNLRLLISYYFSLNFICFFGLWFFFWATKPFPFFLFRKKPVFWPLGKGLAHYKHDSGHSRLFSKEAKALNLQHGKALYYPLHLWLSECNFFGVNTKLYWGRGESDLRPRMQGSMLLTN